MDGSSYYNAKPANKANKRAKKAAKKAAPRKKARVESYASYIKKVLKQVHPDTSISLRGMSVVNSFISDTFERLSREAAGMSRHNKTSTLSSRDIESAVRVVLPGELAKDATEHGRKAVDKVKKEKSDKKKDKAKSRSDIAGLQFPVGRIGRYLKEGRYASRISALAPVYLAAVLEYLTAEVVEIAGNAAKDNKRRRIAPRHIALSVFDQELEALLKSVTIPSGGVIPHIHKSLLPKSSKSKPKVNGNSSSSYYDSSFGSFF